jgi:hypothetical protein
VHWVDIGALDNGAPVTVAQLSAFGSEDEYPVGSTQVTYEAVDSAGNTAVCTFAVVVTDPWSPEFSYCPVGWNVVVYTSPVDEILGQDGRYYAVITWPQPAADDNVGVMWEYTSPTKIYNSDELDVLQADVTASPLPVSTVGGVSQVWAFAPTDTTGAPLKNGGAFPIDSTITTGITYTVHDAAGNIAECPLTVRVVPTHISFYSKEAMAVPRPPSSAASTWAEDTVVAHYHSFVSAEACAEKCHSSANACTAFLASRDGIGQCILLQIDGSNTATDFDQNWDRYIVQSASSQECPGAAVAEQCLTSLAASVDFQELAAAVQEVEVEDGSGIVSGDRARRDATQCLADVTAAYTCAGDAIASGCSDEWVKQVYAEKEAHDQRICTGTAAPAVAAPTPLQTSCTAATVHATLDECTHTCCHIDYDAAAAQCTVLDGDGVVQAGDGRSTSCFVQATTIREECTERCLRARPFGEAGAAIADVFSEADAGNRFGQTVFDGVTFGPPEPGFVDIDLTLNFKHMLAANFSDLNSASTRAAIINAVNEIYGLDFDSLGLDVSIGAGDVSVVRAVQRVALTDQTSIATFGTAATSAYNVPVSAAPTDSIPQFTCTVLAGKTGDYLALLQTDEEVVSTPCSEHVSRLENVAEQCADGIDLLVPGFECLANATEQGHTLIAVGSTTACTRRRDALLAALSRYSPGLLPEISCERSDGESVIRVANCPATVAVIGQLAQASAGGGFSTCRVQDTRSLAQTVFDLYQRTVAVASTSSLHFPPGAAADHSESLINRLTTRLPAEFGGDNGLFSVYMSMEWSSSDITDSMVVPEVATDVFYDFDTVAAVNPNQTAVAVAPSIVSAASEDPAVWFAGEIDESTAGDTTDDDGAENAKASTTSTGVLAFAIIVPLIIIGIIAYVVTEHKRHRKVHVVPTGLSFKQPSAMQALPSRNIPTYKDRTTDDLRNNALAGMPSALNSLPKRMSSSGGEPPSPPKSATLSAPRGMTKLPPPMGVDPFSSAKNKADSADPFGDFN